MITKYHKGRHSLFLYNSEIFYAFTQDILRSLKIGQETGQVKEIGLRICRFLKVILKVSSNRQALQSRTETVFDCSACFS
ncbi:hypothetical protein EFP52_13000 [Lacticaseibacillus paracasei]|nr:hypothetical protein [Lacticaseibacillus paracasei]